MSRGLLGLLLVVMILGGLAALAVTSLSGSTPGPSAGVAGSSSTFDVAAGGSPGTPGSNTGALAASCTADARSVEAAAQDYAAQNGSYPTSVAALVPTWLRSAPSTAHYTIVVDASGHVGVLPPGSTLSGPVPDSADYDRHPQLCDTVPR